MLSLLNVLVIPELGLNTDLSDWSRGDYCISVIYDIAQSMVSLDILQDEVLINLSDEHHL